MRFDRWTLWMLLVALLTTTNMTALPADGGDDPKINLDAQTFDFGNVDEGARITHTFKVSNSGKAVLKLLSAYASCGCTTPKLSKTTLDPGETTELNITVDTSMKHDAVTKEVHISSNDPLRPIIEIDLKMFVRNPHKTLTAAGKAKIFTDQHCASCHVARGVGKLGRDLYNADCAMCHGPKAEGESGPTLIGPYDNQAYAKHMKDVISLGATEHDFMPGFDGEAGGPLAKSQIDSLVTYLKELSNLRNKKK